MMLSVGGRGAFEGGGRWVGFVWKNWIRRGSGIATTQACARTIRVGGGEKKFRVGDLGRGGGARCCRCESCDFLGRGNPSKKMSFLCPECVPLGPEGDLVVSRRV